MLVVLPGPRLAVFQRVAVSGESVAPTISGQSPLGPAGLYVVKGISRPSSRYRGSMWLQLLPALLAFANVGQALANGPGQRITRRQGPLAAPRNIVEHHDRVSDPPHGVVQVG